MKRYENVLLSCEMFSDKDIIATSNGEGGTSNAGTDTPLQPVDPNNMF